MYATNMMVEPTSPGFLVWRLAMLWRTAVDRALAPIGLTHAQYALLSSLYGLQQTGRRPNQRELAEHTGLEVLYTSKLARTLDAAGLIERAPHPDDSRAVQLSLTARGYELARDAVSIVHELFESRLLMPLGGLDGVQTHNLTAQLRLLLAHSDPEETRCSLPNSLAGPNAPTNR